MDLFFNCFYYFRGLFLVRGIRVGDKYKISVFSFINLM